MTRLRQPMPPSCWRRGWGEDGKKLSLGFLGRQDGPMSHSDSNAVRPRRRWLSFTLRSMLIAVAVVAVVLAWPLHVVRTRQAILTMVHERNGRAVRFPFWTKEEIERDGCGVAAVSMIAISRSYPTMPFWRRWLGDQLIGAFELPVDSFSTDDMLDILLAPFQNQRFGDSMRKACRSTQ